MNNVYEKDKIFLHEVGESNIFFSPIISLIGVNSSGKTTALKLFSLANELQSSGNSLSNTWLNRSSSVHNSLLSSKITLTSYIATNKEIFKISSVLELNNNIDQKIITKSRKN